MYTYVRLALRYITRHLLHRKSTKSIYDQPALSLLQVATREVISAADPLKCLVRLVSPTNIPASTPTMSAMQEVPRPEGSGLHQRIDPKDSRWTHHSREFKESFEKGMFVNFPHVVLCEANNPDAVKTEFGWYCFKTRYGIVIDNTTELEILKLGTAGGRGPLSKSTEIRVDCFGLKKAGEAQYYCEGEIPGSKVAFAPEKGIYDIPAGCPYQPKIGAFGNVLDVIKLPYDSRIEVCGTIHEEVLNAILKKRNRRLLQKQSSSIPMIMWIEELEARLAKDRQTDQDSDQAIEGKLLQEQTCRAQTEQEQQSTNHEELGQHGQHVGPFQVCR
jgi:hypothetical protein